MIPAASPALQPVPDDVERRLAQGRLGDATHADWKRLWRDAVRDPRELLALLSLGDIAGRISDVAAAQFPLRVPQGFVSRMRPGDRDDPLLRQVLPLDDEERLVPGFALDAVGDGPARIATGVLRKYHGRALLVATGSCAIHCRYCFRRHYPYGDDNAARNDWRAAIDAIRTDATIDEVILSGGDPLSLATNKLVELTGLLAEIPHVKRLRIHSRLPIVLPQRIDAELLAWLGALPWPVAVVVHANHANEFDPTVDTALDQLRRAGATLLNQAVLLRGVNDSAESLVALSERAYAAGVLPYYLHQLDRVSGAAHFEVPDSIALSLHATMSARLAGYLVPRLVREIPGDSGKRPVSDGGAGYTRS